MEALRVLRTTRDRGQVPPGRLWQLHNTIVAAPDEVRDRIRNLTRMRTDQRTRDYVERRTREGLSKREVMRCLKRYVAREIYRVLTTPSPT